MIHRRIDQWRSSLHQKAAGRREFTPPKKPAISNDFKVLTGEIGMNSQSPDQIWTIFKVRYTWVPDDEPSLAFTQTKAKAKKEGMPYQTLINSILHKAANDR